MNNPMKSDFLRPVPFKAMSTTDRAEWIKNMYMKASEITQHAKDMLEVVCAHQKDMCRLMELYQDTTLEEEEKLDILAAAYELAQAIYEIEQGSIFRDEILSIEEWNAEIEDSPDFFEAKQQVEQEAQGFLERYNFHKSKLGLTTQEQVARLVGIDRRHISRIEQGIVVPQFKTLKRIADAFCISIDDLVPAEQRITRDAP